MLCREEGLDLSQFYAANTDIHQNFNLIAVVKEIGIDDVGLSDFYLDYFTHPLYHDEQRYIYDYLGNRQIKLSTWNPLRWISYLRQMSSRHKSKTTSQGIKLQGNMKGEGLIQGGVILFDSKGVPKYAYREETGDELPIDDIKQAAMTILTTTTTATTTNNQDDTTDTTTTTTTVLENTNNDNSSTNTCTTNSKKQQQQQHKVDGDCTSCADS